MVKEVLIHRVPWESVIDARIKADNVLLQVAANGTWHYDICSVRTMLDALRREDAAVLKVLMMRCPGLTTPIARILKERE